MKNRTPNVPSKFYVNIYGLSKSSLIEVVWDLMTQSPWFDETSADRDPIAVASKAVELAKLYHASAQGS